MAGWQFARWAASYPSFRVTAKNSAEVRAPRELGTRICDCVLERYPDGEVSVQILESVRRREVFLMQPTSPPANDHLIELLALADVCRRAGAARIVAIIPFFG
jgi:ribose-phosphate pyrophosphokinase